MQKRSLYGTGGRWDDFRFLLAIARSGRFKLAAKTLKTDETTVGRRVRALEERIGAKLIDRRLQGMSLTPAGQSAIEHLEAMEHAAYRLECTLLGTDQRLAGTVRVTTTEGLGSYWLTPRLGKCRDEYPDIQIEIITSNDVLDLGAREADISIRYSRPIDPNLVGVEVGVLRFELVCTRGYVAKYGIPSSFESLWSHSLVDHAPYQTIPMWRSFLDTGPRVVYHSNSTSAFLQAIRSGIGIGLVPRFTRRHLNDLVALDLPVDCSLPVWLVSHVETNKAARTRAMWTSLKGLFRNDRAEWFS